MSKKSFLPRLLVGLMLLSLSTPAHADNSPMGKLKGFFGRAKSALSGFVHNLQNAAADSSPSESSNSAPASPVPATQTAAATPTPQAPAPITSIPNACSPLGAQRVAVILATYDGAPSDTAAPNADYVRELFLGATHDFSISDYYKTISRGKAWFESVTVLGPYHSPRPFVADPNTNVDPALDQWETDLVALAGADLDFSQIDRVVFITPNAIDRNGQPVPMAAGLAAQGICDLDSVNAQGIHHPLAHAWVRASTAYLGATTDRINPDPTFVASLSTDSVNASLRRFQMLDMAPITHELGHTFGLGHSNQVNRPQSSTITQFMNNEILPAATDTLYEIAYGDPFSVMGATSNQWLNVAHLNQLGWIDASELQEIRTEGTYRIYPLEGPAGTLKGLKIPRVIQSPNESTVSDLWVEFRQKTTVYDTELNLSHSTAGAIVHYTNPNQPGPDSIWPFETVLLNFHPDGQPVNPYETDYTLTTSWKDDHSMVKLDVVQATTEFLDIHVSFQP